MKVWVVEHWYVHEGGSVEGVFASREGAMAFVQSRPVRDNLDPKRAWRDTDHGKVRPSPLDGAIVEGWTFEALDLQP